MSQISRVESILKDGQPKTLWMIKSEILKRFHKMDSEAGISARIRQLRDSYESQGKTIKSQRYKDSNAHEYWVAVKGGEE